MGTILGATVRGVSKTPASDSAMEMKTEIAEQPNEAPKEGSALAAPNTGVEMITPKRLKMEIPLASEETPQLVQAEDFYLMVDLGKRQLAALESGFMTDVVILVGDEKVKCHSNIVSFASPKLAAVVKEKEPRLPDVDPRHFRLLLQIIYSETMAESEDVETLIQVGQVAFQLQVHTALMFCNYYFTKKLDVENLWTILDFAFLIGDAGLKEFCLETIRNETASIIQTEEFLMCKRSTLDLILKQDKLCAVTELDLFQACVAWARANTDEAENRRAVMDSVLRLIRFRTLSAKEFANHVIPTGLLSVDIERDILRSLVTRANFMPEGFSVSLHSRDPEQKMKDFRRLVRETTDAGLNNLVFPIFSQSTKNLGGTGFFGNPAQ